VHLCWFRTTACFKGFSSAIVTNYALNNFVDLD
jgi:hypothetical protein